MGGVGNVNQTFRAGAEIGVAQVGCAPLGDHPIGVASTERDLSALDAQHNTARRTIAGG